MKGSFYYAYIRIYTSMFCGLRVTRYTPYYSIVMLPFGHAVTSTSLWKHYLHA